MSFLLSSCRFVDELKLQLPKWPEEVVASRNRYAHVIKALADKYPTENLLLVTHGIALHFVLSYFISLIFSLSLSLYIYIYVDFILWTCLGEGVGVAVSTFMEGVTVYEVDYCAYALLKRPIFYRDDESYTGGEFQVQTMRHISTFGSHK